MECHNVKSLCRSSQNFNLQIRTTIHRFWTVQSRRLGSASGLVVLPVQLRGIPYCELHLSRGEGEVLLGEICRWRSTLPLESSQVSPNIENPNLDNLERIRNSVTCCQAFAETRNTFQYGVMEVLLVADSIRWIYNVF